MDQSKKTMRHFYCRDVLWETFEQMANDFDCSIDYLVNEAMRYYARSKNYQSPGGPAVTGQQPVGGPNGPGPNASGPNSYPKPPSGGGRSPAPTNQPVPQAAMGGPTNGMGAGGAARRPAPPTPRYAPPRTGGPSAAPPTGHMAAQHAPAPMPAPAPNAMPQM